jgi:hypothetical protein
MNREWLKANLPIAGIVAFSACSVHAVNMLLRGAAKHDTPLYLGAACLIELTTAWLVWSIVEAVRKVTRSNISKQDRRFHSIVLVVFLVLAIPSLAISVEANTRELGGRLLGLLFPSLCVACAVGAGLPDTVERYERQKEDEKKAAKEERARKKAEKERVEATRKQAESLGAASATFLQLTKDPAQSQAQIAEAIGRSRTAVRNHLDTLEEEGAIKRHPDGTIEILWGIE